MFKIGNFYKFEFHKGVCVQVLGPASEAGKWRVEWYDVLENNVLVCRGLKDVLVLSSGWTLITIKQKGA